jgi:hypothetical protein
VSDIASEVEELSGSDLEKKSSSKCCAHIQLVILAL